MSPSSDEFDIDDVMSWESNRFKSYDLYKTSHRNSHLKEIKCLAANGFYYKHNENRVVCYYCHYKANGPFNYDMIISKHKKSDFCPIANGGNGDLATDIGNAHVVQNETQDIETYFLLNDPASTVPQGTSANLSNSLNEHSTDIGNVGIEHLIPLPSLAKFNSLEISNYEECESSSSLGKEECNTLFSHDHRFDYEDDDPIYEEAANPDFSSYDIRLKSFRRWPEAIRARPPELADAGFFYTGVFDNVKCFYCDGGIRNFSPTDKAWEDHAKWYPTCKFLLEKQGQVFVEEVVERHRQEQEEKKRIARQTLVNSGTIVESTKCPSLEKDIIESNTAIDYLESLIELGYERDVVAETIVERFRSTGKMHDNEEELIGDLIRKEGQGVTVISASSSHNSKRRTKNKKKNKSKTQSNQKQPNVNTVACASPLTSSPASSECDSNSLSLDKLAQEREELINRKLCIICTDAPRDTVLLPCAHFNTCANCAAKVEYCPVCRKWIKGTIKVFL